MLIFNSPRALSAHLSSLRDASATVGFVPTMGALHDGHLSLLRQSVHENQITVVSIFVNPTQFNNSEDLANYPRTVEADLEKIKSVSADIIAFVPSVSDMYENSPTSDPFSYGGLEHQMEGRHRPGHFDGVGTIVSRLFRIVSPNRAYFGEKDFQQLQIVRELARRDFPQIQIVGCPVSREPNGLARSSRNERLSAESRDRASLIYAVMQNVQSDFGTKTAEELAADVKNAFANEPGFELEYFEIADEETLVRTDYFEPGKKYRAFIALYLDNVRLIDTVSLN